MSDAAHNVTHRALSGFLWMSLATGANILAMLVVTVTLAHLLTPADFGVVAVALLVIGFCRIFSELGIGPALVQRPELRSEHLRVGFTLSVLLGLLLAGVTAATAEPIAVFFHLPVLTPVIMVLAATFPLLGLSVVAESLLQRELRFRCLATVDVVSFVTGYGLLGIGLAVYGYGIWALVAAHLGQTAVRSVLIMTARPHAAAPLFDPAAAKELLYFGGGLTAGRISNYFAGQAENVVIGRWLGADALGIYGRAYQLMAGPPVLFGNVLDSVLFPALAHFQHQQDRLAEAYRRGNALIALVILPVSAGVVLLAPEIVHVVLGPAWSGVVLPLQILGVGMLFRIGCKISDSLVRATGAVYRRSWRQAVYALLVFVGALVGQQYGVNGVAVAVLITLAINYALMAHLSLHLTGMSWGSLAATCVPGLALALLFGAPLGSAAELLRRHEYPAFVVLAGGVAAMIPALLFVYLWPGLFLGPDGMWMLRKLITFYSGRDTPEWPEGNMTASTPLPPASEPCATVPADHPSPLAELLQHLRTAGVRCCRWKAKVDPARVLNGAGDLDLLVARADAARFLQAAAEHGFKRVGSWCPQDETVEQHLYGLDPVTGVFVHLHIHFLLLASSGSLAPPFEERVLQHARPDAAGAIFGAVPAVRPEGELIIRVLQTMERYTSLREYPWLIAQRRRDEEKLQALLTGAADWRSLLAEWLPAMPPALFAECAEVLANPRASWLRRFRLAARFQRQLAQDGALATAPASSRAAPLAALWRRLSTGRGNPKKLAEGGVIIAFIGPDASGKSTLVSETSTWLSRVFRVRTAHLGKPPPTWLTWLPSVVWNLCCRWSPRLRTGGTRQSSNGTSDASPGIVYGVRAVLLAWERRALALRLARQAAGGWLVVCDRYPSPEVGAADSARLPASESARGSGWLARCLARLEQHFYRQIRPPDIVVRLSAPLEMALERNTVRKHVGKESDDYVIRRHKEFCVPNFPEARTIALDTSGTRAATVDALRRRLWQLL